MIKVTIVDDLLKVDIDTETSTVDIHSVTPSVNVVNVPDFTTKVVSPQYAVTLKQYGIQSQPTLLAAALEKQLAEIMAMSETLVFNAQTAFLEALGLIEDLAKSASTQLSETMAITEDVTFVQGLNLEEATLIEETFDRMFTAFVELADTYSFQEDLTLAPLIVLPTDTMALSEVDFSAILSPSFDLQDSLVITESTLFGVSLDYLEQTTLLESVLFGVSLSYTEQTTLVEIPVLTFTTTLVENSVTASEVFAITPNIIYTDTIVSSEGLTMYLQDYVQDYLPTDYVGSIYQY